MANTDQDRANTIRAEGNAYYNSGNLDKAIEAYERALALVPADTAILGNLSISRYESGDYDVCIEHAEKALALHLGVETPDAAKVEELARRISKAKIHHNLSAETEQRDRRLRLIEDLPRYHPAMSDGVVYYPIGRFSPRMIDVILTSYEPINLIRFRCEDSDCQVSIGHDEASSLFNPKIIETAAEEKSVSLLFAGIGDARNMLRTIIDIAEYDRRPASKRRDYHLTIIDINKCSITRDLIVLMLLDELASHDEGSDEALDVLNTLYYVYIAPLMPRCAFIRLHSTISRALAALKSGSQPLRSVYCHINDMPKYIEILNQWQTEALTVFTTPKVIKNVKEQLGKFGNTMPGMGPSLPAGCEEEKQLYFMTAMLMSPDRIMELHDPKLAVLLKQYSKSLNQHAGEFEKHAKEHWEVNTTFVDVSWYNSLFDKRQYNLSHDPFKTRASFEDKTLSDQSQKPTRLFDYFAPFFQDVAKAMKHFEGQIRIEVVLDDYIDFVKQLRFGLYREPDGSSPADSKRPKDFPNLYDRIHLGNIPDYTNGHLSTFVYATPLLKQFESCTVQSNCLRNTGTWVNIEAFLTDYQLISDRSMLKQLTQVEIVHDGGFPLFPLPLGNYTIYRRIRAPSSRFFRELLPRTAFRKWFYGLFFRLALPFCQDPRNFHYLILSPVNLSILFRQVEQLRFLGYPSHWMSECLTAIIENTVVSTCRPPESSPATNTEVETIHPMKKLSTGPFKDEMATLTRLFEPLLPFTLISDAIPKEDDIYLYSFTLLNHERNLENSGDSVFLSLAFWDRELATDAGVFALGALRDNLRSLLDPTFPDVAEHQVPQLLKGPQLKILREHGLIVWSTITWDEQKKEVSAWMPEKFVDHMVKQNFCCGLYRTDTWAPIVSDWTGWNYVRDTVKQGRKWSAVNTSSMGPMESLKI